MGTDFQQWEKEFEETRKRNNEISEEIINLLKSRDLTFEAAEKILRDTIDILHKVSGRRTL